MADSLRLSGLGAAQGHVQSAAQRQSSSQIDFLKLLLAKLANQNPLDMEKQEDFLGQLAMFENLNQVIKLNKSFEQSALSQQIAQSSSLLGKTVEHEAGSDGATAVGVVKAVRIMNGVVVVQVDDLQVEFSKIKGVWTADDKPH
jgi:flagellar basal-body rod modification protein FlgD